MKVKKGFILRKVGTQYVVVATGMESKNFHGMLRLNEEGAFAFGLLKEDLTEEQLVSAMLEKYPGDLQETKAGVEIFLSTLKEAGALV